MFHPSGNCLNIFTNFKVKIKKSLKTIDKIGLICE